MCWRRETWKGSSSRLSPSYDRSSLQRPRPDMLSLQCGCGIIRRMADVCFLEDCGWSFGLIFPEHRCWLTEPRRGKEYNDVRGSQESSRRIEFTGSVSPGACTNPLAACHNAPRYSTELVPGNVREVAEQAGICWFQHVTQKRRTSFTQASWLMVRK